MQRALLTGLALLLGCPAAACDVALALTVDVSGSISPTEYDLQMTGLADALDEPSIAESLVSNRIALILIQWSGAGRQVVSLPWTQITSASDLAAYSAQVRGTERAWRHFSTAIGDALAFTQTQFENAPDCARRVIDVSGDGFSNEGRDTATARNNLAAAGITVNGLAIENNVQGLSDYFRSEVIGGPGSFVITAEGYRDYPRAIRRKLLSEVVKPAS